MSLSAAHLRSLDQDGYAVVQGLVDDAEVAGLQAAVRRLEAAAARGQGDPRRLVTQRDRLLRVVWCEGLDPAFDRWGADPRVLAIARQVLGVEPTGPVVQLLQQLHPKDPLGEVDYAPHQDASNRRYGSDLWRDPGPQGGFVQVVLALDPAHRASGGLLVWPGSHRQGFVATPGAGVIPPQHCDPARARALSLDPGDALVFGPFLIHGSPPNVSHHRRTLFIQGYTRPGVNGRRYPGSGLGVLRGARPE